MLELGFPLLISGVLFFLHVAATNAHLVLGVALHSC